MDSIGGDPLDEAPRDLGQWRAIKDFEDILDPRRRDVAMRDAPDDPGGDPVAERYGNEIAGADGQAVGYPIVVGAGQRQRQQHCNPVTGGEGAYLRL